MLEYCCTKYCFSVLRIFMVVFCCEFLSFAVEIIVIILQLSVLSMSFTFLHFYSVYCFGADFAFFKQFVFTEANSDCICLPSSRTDSALKVSRNWEAHFTNTLF